MVPGKAEINRRVLGRCSVVSLLARTTGRGFDERWNFSERMFYSFCNPFTFRGTNNGVFFFKCFDFGASGGFSPKLFRFELLCREQPLQNVCFLCEILFLMLVGAPMEATCFRISSRREISLFHITQTHQAFSLLVFGQCLMVVFEVLCHRQETRRWWTCIGSRISQPSTTIQKGTSNCFRSLYHWLHSLTKVSKCRDLISNGVQHRSSKLCPQAAVVHDLSFWNRQNRKGLQNAWIYMCAIWEVVYPSHGRWLLLG